MEYINLIRLEVVGLQYHNYLRYVEKIKVGDCLELRREADNVHDSKAISLFYDKVKIGYLPKESNAILAAIMDGEVPLEARVSKHNKEASILKGDGRLMVAIYMEIY